jgi:hypothetical protein
MDSVLNDFNCLDAQCAMSRVAQVSPEEHQWGKDGFCMLCHNIHRTDNNARSTCSNGFRCFTPEEHAEYQAYIDAQRNEIDFILDSMK